MTTKLSTEFGRFDDFNYLCTFNPSFDMINRGLIRVKVVQMLYSYMLTRPERTFEQALQDLQASFEKSYDLYLYLIKLIPDLTYIEERRLDDAKHKFQPTEDELNPNTRFIDNQLTRAINDNPAVEKIFRDHMISWNDDPIFMRLLLDKIRNSEVYQDYMALPFTDLMSDTEVWRQLLRKVILDDEDVEEQLQNRSLYISSEDLEVMGQFAIKSLSKIADGEDDPIKPMFKDKEDSVFGEELFSKTVRDMDDNNVLIDSCVRSERWDRTRVALMDRIIMCTAITELKCFEKIPASVTLNEYIDLAKIFSTPQSGQFVNGVLNAVVDELRSRGRINK